MIRIFVLMLILDFLIAYYTRATVSRKGLIAGALSAAIVSVSASVTYSYVRDPRLIIPAAVGAFAGTWLCSRV